MAARASASQMAHVVSLERVSEHIDAATVKDLLRQYGEITDVQFWISHNEKRHGFVTFANPRDARNCLRRARESEPVLHVKCIDPCSVDHYQRHQILPVGIFQALNPTDSPTSPMLLKTMDVELLTPLSGKNLEEIEDSKSRGKQESLWHSSPSPIQAKASQSLPASPSCQIDTHLSDCCPLTVDVNKTPPATAPLLPAYPLTPISPFSGSAIFEHTGSGTRGRADEAATDLAGEIAKLRLDLSISREASNDSLRVAFEEKERYRAERDALSKELRRMKREMEYYKAKSEDLADDLADEAESHRKKRNELKYYLYGANEKVSNLQKELERQSQLLSQRQLELDERRPKLQTAQRSTRSTADLEDGQLVPRTPFTSINPFNLTSPDLDYPGRVLPALEKAFIYLEEMTAAALLKVDGVEQEEDNIERIHKRQKKI